MPCATRGGGGGEAPGRDRVPDRRQDAVAAYRRDRVADVLPHLAQTRRLPENLTGIVVHDHWKPYYTLNGVKHALCNAHHLRELKALVEIEKEDWARKMQRLLRRACHATNLARERGEPLSPRLIALSSGATMPSWPRASRSTPRNPLVRALPKGKGKRVAASRAGSAITCCCA